MAMQWLEQRWPGLLHDLSEYELGDEGVEAEIQAICEAEMAIWRTYCQAEDPLCFQLMMLHTRTCLRVNLPAPWSEWWNPEAEEWEHIGLKYLNCTEGEWEQLRKQSLDHRLLLHDPETLVSRAKGLLYKGLMEAHAWPELVVGIAVLTGRTLLQILKHGCFSLKTPFSLLFRDTVSFNPFFRNPFEIPTLGRADLIVEAWERVRALVDCSQRDEQELLQAYSQMVKEAAEAHFHDLVPLHPGEKDLFRAISCSVYPCLATYYYCPPSVDEVNYIAKVTGKPLVLFLSSPGERFAYSAVMNHAFEYAVADEQGRIDERKSLWLDRDGVKIVEALQRPEDVGRYADHQVIKVVFDEDDLQAFEDLRCQMDYGLPAEEGGQEGKKGQEDEETTSSEYLELSIRFHNHGVSPSLYAFVQAGVKHLRGDIAEFMRVYLQDELVEGLKFQRPFQTMSTSELMVCTHSQAIYELARRTIVTLIQYNRTFSDPEMCWYLNEEVIFQVIQKERYYIRWCLEDYQEEIDQHHRAFNLTPLCNVKSLAITEVIHLDESPHSFGEDDLFG